MEAQTTRKYLQIRTDPVKADIRELRNNPESGRGSAREPRRTPTQAAQGTPRTVDRAPF